MLTPDPVFGSMAAAGGEILGENLKNAEMAGISCGFGGNPLYQRPLVLTLYVVMAGLDPAIHFFDSFGVEDMDARLKAGHDD